jgi:hypothetical protein
MTKLIPNEPLIYERADGVVYARYSRRPEIPRWIIGGDPGAVRKSQNDLIDYSEWQELCELSTSNAVLKKQLDNLIQTYYIIKDGK